MGPLVGGAVRRTLLRALFVPLLAALLLAGCAPPPSVSAGAGEARAKTSGPEDPDASEAGILREEETVRRRLELLLGRTFAHPVRARVVTAAQARRLAEAEVDAELSGEEIAAQAEALALLGLLPPRFDLKRAYLDLLQSQAAGFYIPRTKTLYLVRGQPFSSVIVAHELTHALQDAALGLETETRRRREDDDALLAFTALLEGEATLAMSVYMAEYASPWELLAGTAAAAFLGDAQMAALRQAPLYLRETLLFPYLDGQRFVSAAFRRGGWRGVLALYRHPPESTEQILHPAKYFLRPDRPSRLCTPAAPGEGLERRVENTLGEFGLHLLLRARGSDFLSARQAARGWDGDRYALYRRADGSGVLLLLLAVWDSPADARRYAEALREAFAKEDGRRAETGTEANGNVSCESQLLEGGILLVFANAFPEEREALRRAVETLRAEGTLFLMDNRADAAGEAAEPEAPAEEEATEAGIDAAEYGAE